MALSSRRIGRPKPGLKRREIADGEVGGLYKITQPSGKESWAYRFRFHGRSRKYTIGDASKLSVKDARVLARKAYLSVIKCRSGCGKETIAER